MEEYINVCLQEARKSNIKIKVGAILVYRNKIVSRGHNYIKKGFVRNFCCPL